MLTAFARSVAGGFGADFRLVSGLVLPVSEAMRDAVVTVAGALPAAGWWVIAVSGAVVGAGSWRFLARQRLVTGLRIRFRSG